MRVAELLRDKGAVSSSISVVLMVAVVVILASVVSVFALGIGEDVEKTAPSASFDFEVLDNGDVQVTHENGDEFEGDQLRFAGAAHEKTAFGGIDEWNGKTVKSSDSASVNVKGGETLRLIWWSPDSDVTATVAEYDVPEYVDPKASIGSVDTDYYTWLRGELTINNIQFSRVENDNVYVVVEDEPSGGSVTEETYFSTDGGDLSVRLVPDSNVEHGETITVTVYETASKSNELTTATAVVP